MKLELNGAINARDIGGIETSLGTVKRNTLLRSGELERITPQDVEILKRTGLARVIDLRTAVERTNSPDVKIEGVQYVEVPIIESTTFGITYEKSGGSEIARMLQLGIEKMKAQGKSPEQHLSGMYTKFVNQQFCRNGYGKFLKTLAQPVNGATLWHCTVGKDRCGTCAALLLHCLGASKQQIYDDYMLTNEQTAEHKNMILDKVREFVSPQDLELIAIFRSVTVAYLDSFFAEIQAHYGSTDSFLKACGVTESDVQSLRKNYLE